MNRKQFVLLAVGVAVLAAGMVAITEVLDWPGSGTAATDEVAVPAPVEQHNTSRGLFYRVDGGANTAYLFGSIHFGHAEMYPLHASVEETFQDADVLVMEIDMAAQSREEIDREMRAYGTYNGSRRMTDTVDNATFETVYTILAPHGYNRTAVNRMKPWYAANLISERGMEDAGYDPERGGETYFTDLAAEQGTPVIGMETVEDQAAAFETMSVAAQQVYLTGAIRNYQRGSPHLDAMADDWMAGNETAFAQQRHTMRRTAQPPSMERFNEALLDERDARMADSIAALLEDGSGDTYFIVVGSLHLVGENSIPDNLADDGYTVTDMYANG